MKPAEVDSMSKNAAILLALVALLVATAPAGALEYEIQLKNGNVFQTRYEPVESPFDPTRIMFTTIFGNSVTISRDQVSEVISVTEAAGFGKRLDATTILIGLAPNDNLTPEEEAALAAQQGVTFQVPAPYSIEQFAEPEATGGIPLNFLNTTTPPLGNSGFSGSAAALRRSQGGTQFVEPQTRD
jgi:hypothetical protein